MTKTITVIGAGNSGLAMAAHLTFNGHKVILWNRSEDTIRSIIDGGQINYSGIINGTIKLHQVTTNIQRAIAQSELIMITTPASSHKDLAQLLGPFIRDSQMIVLNPGRTLGVIEFQYQLIKSGCHARPLIAETQSIIYTCRKLSWDTVKVLNFKRNILFSCLRPEDTEKIFAKIPKCLKAFLTPCSSIIDTSFGNVGMILHCAPVIFNTGWIEYKQVQFKYYYNGITQTIANFLERLDKERIMVAALLNIEIESTKDWLKRIYFASGDTLYECIQSIDAYKEIDAPETVRHRYIFEDIPTGLVPLEMIGKILNLPMKNTGNIIDVANSLFETDFRKIGRNSSKLGMGDLTDAKELLAFLNAGHFK